MTALPSSPPSVLALDDAALTKLMARALAGERVDGVARAPGPVHVAFRRRGLALGALWLEERDVGQVLRRAFAGAAAFGADALQVDFAHRFRPIGRRLVPVVFVNAHRGLLGLQIRFGEHLERLAPSQMIATNRSFARGLELFFERLGIDERGFYEGGGMLDAFDTRQVLIDLEGAPRATTLFRGAPIVRPDEVDHGTVARMIPELGAWLAANLADDGRLTYAWWPSAGQAPPADNTIRQFMATLALIRLARRTGTAADRERAARHLASNLKRFYLRIGDIGMISYGGSAKLGAAALAALAILQAPSGTRYADELRALHAGVLALREPGGRFRTFHQPAARGDNQNFYPGEAQLYLASRLRIHPEPELLAKCLESAAFYRNWHLENRNPAFVPWHSQANAILFELAGEPWLRDFVFLMNDWLLPLQQWAEAPAPDLAGRFYAPKRPDFGPPHASSTGVYLEGLAEALRLADAAGDEARATAYRRAIWRGLRSLRQLQFKDPRDAFYISQRERVIGGLRTEAYDNRIRVDNVQHALLALLALTALPAFRNHPPVW